MAVRPAPEPGRAAGHLGSSGYKRRRGATSSSWWARERARWLPGNSSPRGWWLIRIAGWRRPSSPVFSIRARRRWLLHGPRGRSAAALQEALAPSESAPADSEPAHEAARRPRLGLSHPRIDDNYRSTT